jgi:hypothetical protein
MAAFDFIVSGDFRASLERDAEELVRCMRAGTWKSAYVMAASLIQATLVDYLASAGMGGEDELSRLGLPELLDLCSRQRVLSPRTVELADFLKPPSDFLSSHSRVRLEAATDETGARIAQALLEIVTNEVSNHRRETFHFSAEQVVAKIRSDSSAVAILDHLLRKVSRSEMEKLLLELLPRAYFDTVKSGDPHAEGALQRFEAGFRMAFDAAPTELKRAVAARFLTILENESEYVVQSYQRCFFRASDLQFLDEEGRAIVKAHLLASLAKQVTLPLLNASSGVAGFLGTEEEGRAFFVPLVMSLLEQTDRTLVAATLRRIGEELARLPAQNRKSITGWIGRLRQSLEQDARPREAAVIARLESELRAIPGSPPFAPA